MNWQAWFTLAVVIVTIAVLVKDLLTPAVTLTAAMVTVLAAGIVSPSEALSGFSNPAPVTIAALYVISAAARRSGALTGLVHRTLRHEASERANLARLTLPVAAASGFFNNTPIVAMLAPQIERWATQRGLSPSRYLIPLSFAAIFGGVLTLMGTATNVVVSGLMEAEGMAPLGFFEISKIGVPVAAAGLGLMIVLAPKVLPRRTSAEQDAVSGYRDFTVAMTVEPGSPLDGASVEAAGLRHLHGVFLTSLEHAGETIVPVHPDRLLVGGDTLVFAGRVSDIVDLEQVPGLAPAEQTQMLRLNSETQAYYQAVVGPASPVTGRTLREFGFRNRYQAAVVAIHRAGERVTEKLGGVTLRPGDTLLVSADSGWADRWGDRQDFLLVARLGADVLSRSNGRAVAVLTVAGAAIVAAATGLLPLVTAALLAAGILVVTRMVTPAQAKRAIDLDVIVAIASAFGLAAAIEASGLASTLAGGAVDVTGPLGAVGVLAGLVVVTVVLKELVTNNAAVLIMLPIAVAVASQLGIDPRGLAIGVGIAAATPLLTPIGYQTNLMVYGPGGYRFGDYLRLGLPLTVAVIAVILVGVPIAWPL